MRRHDGGHHLSVGGMFGGGMRPGMGGLWWWSSAGWVQHAMQGIGGATVAVGVGGFGCLCVFGGGRGDNIAMVMLVVEIVW